jgi:predicted RNase H-like nuclease (RuvC/YqgF family)
MHPGLTLGGLTQTKGGWASILTITAGINWAALGTWIGAQNWVAISTTIGLVIFNVAVGYTAAVNYYHAGRAKHRREQEELDKDSWSVKLARMAKERDEARDEVADLNREVAGLKEDIARLEADYGALRESAHKQRGEMNRQVLKEVNEANDLRNRMWELTREVEELRARAAGNNQPKGSV